VAIIAAVAGWLARTENIVSPSVFPPEGMVWPRKVLATFLWMTGLKIKLPSVQLIVQPARICAACCTS